MYARPTRAALMLALAFLAFALLFAWHNPSDTDVRFSAASGFYEDEVLLEMACSVPGADVYYTTDGSVPTARSLYYDGPVLLDNVDGEYGPLSDYTGISHEDYVPDMGMVRGHVIRAAAFRGEERIGGVQSASYFIGIDREDDYGDVPVVSLIMEEDDLFDYETGIYTLGMTYDDWYAEHGEEPHGWWEPQGNFSNKGLSWERPVHVDYLPADGSEGFHQQMGVRIKGGATRIYNQKSLRLIARDEYGDDRVRYPLLGRHERADGEGLVESYKQFTLRSGGNDCSFTKLRDPLVQNLSSDLRLDTQQNRPCIVFINGEYWGLYTIIEEYSGRDIENNYGIEKENVVLIKRSVVENGQESDHQLFDSMFAFITENDMSVEENYRKASAMLDMGNAADFFAVQFYVNNTDGIPQNNNNWQMWRARTLDSSNPYGDGRWRLLLYDMDGSADLLGDGTNVTVDCISPSLSGQTDRPFAQLLRSLCQSEAFLRELILSMCDVRNIHFGPERFSAEMQSLREVYEPLLPGCLYRFGPENTVYAGAEDFCRQELDELETFFMGRWEVFPWIMQYALKLQSPASLHLSCIGNGAVMVNHSVPDMPNGYTGLYFPDYPITLTALENGEGRFVRWEGEGCEIADPYAMSTEIAFEGDFAVRAVFE